MVTLGFVDIFIFFKPAGRGLAQFFIAASVIPNDHRIPKVQNGAIWPIESALTFLPRVSPCPMPVTPHIYPTIPPDTFGENWITQRKPTKKQGEHTNSTVISGWN